MSWTNGRLHPVCHRVMMTGNEARYSAGLFSFPKAGYIVKAPEELVDQQHPLTISNSCDSLVRKLVEKMELLLLRFIVALQIKLICNFH